MNRNQIIEEMADAALANYEFSCEWNKAAEAARESAQENGLKADKPLVLHAVNLARVRWNELALKTRETVKGNR